MENLRKRVDIDLSQNLKAICQKLVSTSIFISQKIFDKNLVTVRKIKEVLTLNKQHMLLCVY